MIHVRDSFGVTRVGTGQTMTIFEDAKKKFCGCGCSDSETSPSPKRDNSGY